LSKQFWMFLLVGLVVAGAAVGFLMWWNRGAHLELKGSILKVRTLQTDEVNSIAIIDFRFVNSSDYPFVVRKVDVTLEDAGGTVVESVPVSDVDATRLFQYYKVLGPKYNPSLLMRDRLAGQQSLDRMIAAAFPIPEEKVQKRKRLRIRVEDVDGAVSEISEATPVR
jgi:hypothetical protein